LPSRVLAGLAVYRAASDISMGGSASDGIARDIGGRRLITARFATRALFQTARLFAAHQHRVFASPLRGASGDMGSASSVRLDMFPGSRLNGL